MLSITEHVRFIIQSRPMPPTPRRSQPTPAVERRAQAIADRLRKNHAIGEASLASRLPTAEFAAKKGLSIFSIYKARVFAEAYSPDDLNRLCKLRRADGLALTFGHVNILTIIRKSDRPAFERKIANHNWTPARAHAEVKARYHQNRRLWGGRPVKLPADPEDVMHQIVESATAWTRKHHELFRRLQSDRRRLPAALRKESVRTLDDLIKVADQLRRRLGRGS